MASSPPRRSATFGRGKRLPWVERTICPVRGKGLAPMTENLNRLTSLADVAELAGVSVTTASRVLSGSAHRSRPRRGPGWSKLRASSTSSPTWSPRLVISRTHLVAVFVHDISGRVLRAHRARCRRRRLRERLLDHRVRNRSRSRQGDRYVRQARSGASTRSSTPVRAPPTPHKQVELVAQLRRVEDAGAVLLRLAPTRPSGPTCRTRLVRIRSPRRPSRRARNREFAYVGAPAALNSTKVARHALAEVLKRHGIEFVPTT